MREPDNLCKIYTPEARDRRDMTKLLSAYTIEKSALGADLVYLSGGADVNPTLYGEKRGYRTNIDEHRDKREEVLYRYCISAGIPMFGICRGAQFLTIMNGGRLIQHVNNHTSNHNIVNHEGEVFSRVTSTHHQMMFPYDMPEGTYRVLATPPDPLATIYFNGNDEDFTFKTRKISIVSSLKPFLEPEVVYYPETKCLCVQPHPELMEESHAFVKWIKELLKDLITNPDNLAKLPSFGPFRLKELAKI